MRNRVQDRQREKIKLEDKYRKTKGDTWREANRVRPRARYGS